MTSKNVALLLADLGVTRSLSRPHVSNDNPYPESQFKTLKHSPRFPERFASLPHARAFIDGFFDHYNLHHRHSGIGYHTPADVHAGRHHDCARILTFDRSGSPRMYGLHAAYGPVVGDLQWLPWGQRS